MLRNWRKNEIKMFQQNNIKTTKRMNGGSSPKWPEIENKLVESVKVERGEKRGSFLPTIFVIKHFR
jgi:hypothetical protein